MQHPVSLRMRSTWISIPLWKRAAGVILIACLAFQLVFLAGIWREWQIRRQLSPKVILFVGRPALPVGLVQLLNRFLPIGISDLVAPVETVVAFDPTDHELRTLSKFRQLKKVRIVFGRSTQRGIKSLSTMNSMEELYLENACVDAESLTGLPTCRKLRNLQLFGAMVPESLGPLKDCIALEVLQMQEDDRAPEGHRRLNSIGSPHLAAVARVPNLKRLGIDSLTITEADLSSLAVAQQLQELSIGASDLQFGGDGLNAIGHLPRLSLLTLNIASAQRSPKPLEGFPALRVLVLTNTSVSPELLYSIKELPQLEALSLARCKVNESLPSLVGSLTLKRLDLNASDANMDGIAQIARHKTIEVIAVSQSDLRSEISARFPNLATPRHIDWQSKVNLSN